MALRFFLFVTSLVLWTGCAAYKELEPKPPVSPVEGGFIELKNDKKSFELKKDKKYFIKFPRTKISNFYLVLQLSDKSAIHSFLTQTFNDGKGIITTITDETHLPDSLSVFALDTSTAIFYWVIDSVKSDLLLRMDYRYVPVWRYKWEIKNAELRKALEQNRIDRQPYQTLGQSFSFEGFNFEAAINDIQAKTEQLNDANSALEEIKQTFPSDIVTYNDIAYQNYKQLKSDIEDELKFQADYLATVEIFYLESKTRSKTDAFVKIVPDLLSYLAQNDRWPANVKTEAKKVFGYRLREVTQFYDSILKNKNDILPITLEINTIDSLHKICHDSVASDFKAQSAFIRRFNSYATPFEPYAGELNAVKNKIALMKIWPDNNFYPGVLAEVAALKKRIPSVDASVFGDFKNYACVILLVKETVSSSQSIAALEVSYKRAEILAPQINTLKETSDYRGVIRLLKKNKDLDFFLGHYTDVDQLSLDRQKSLISAALKDSQWTEAETNLRSLHLDQEFMNPNAIAVAKSQAVKSLEEEFFSSVETISKLRVNEFAEANKLTTDSVENLYKNNAFLPAHDITFYTGSEKDFLKRKKAMTDRLETMKNETFPAIAIESLYKDFTSNINNNGVAKARAVATHGKFYKGNDKKIVNLVAECDTRIAKWITKPAQYRKFYVLPVTSNKKGSNEYVFRLNVQIESEAQFPVFDINIKLPEEVSKTASLKPWYDEISLNKKPLKNEGRFTITSPTMANDYECQVSPVQMVKNDNNILEVRFTHDSFKVFEISVMAQKPIIKKN